MTATLPSLSSVKSVVPNPGWTSLPLFDRTGWKRVRFGEVVVNCNETCDPDSAGLERFVAMEHLEPGSLHVRSWGNVADGTTFTRRCRPGQVLFGKRRAYQRKVAVAEFEAVVSGDIYVLAPKDTRRLLPELLPFLCLSERFFQHAVGTSAGSLSPRTNWSSLASFEFDLPPLDQQRRIAEILVSAERVAERWSTTIGEANALRRASILSLYESGVSASSFSMTALGKRPSHWQVAPLESHYEVQLGKKLYEKEKSGPHLRPYLRNANVQWNYLDLSDVGHLAFPPDEARKYELRYGDILACEGRHVGKSAIWRDEIPGACFQMALHRIRATESDQEPRFLLYHMQYSSWRGLFEMGTGTTTIPHLPAEKLKKIPFSFPPIAEQREIAGRIETIDRAIADATKTQVASVGVLEALVASVVCISP